MVLCVVWDVHRWLLMAKTGPVLVRFVENKVAVGQVFLRVFQLSLAVSPIAMLHALST